MPVKKKLTRNLRDRGEVLIEAALALPFIAFVVVGFAQQFAVVSKKLEHVTLATEIMMGPQERALQYNTDSAAFGTLTDVSTPTFDQFIDTIGDFAKLRQSPSTTVIVSLGYLRMDKETGRPNTSAGPFILGEKTYAGTAADTCLSGRVSEQLQEYSNAQLAAMQGYNDVDASTNGRAAFAPKLYDVKIGSTSYKGYIDYLPMIFLLVCSEPVNGIWPQTPVSTFTLVPRRLVN